METQNLANMLGQNTLELINNSPAFRTAIDQLAICFREHAKELQPGSGDYSLNMSSLVQPQKQKPALDLEQVVALDRISDAIQSNKLDRIDVPALIDILTYIDKSIDKSDREVMMTKTLGVDPMQRNYYAAIAQIPGSETFAYRLVSSIKTTDERTIWQRFIAAIKESTQNY